MEITIFTDGGSRGNPGLAGIGVVVMHGSKIIFEQGKTIGIATNNDAEYQAFLLSLKWLLKEKAVQGITQITWKLDSKLVVEQLNRKWKIKEPRIREYAQKCWQILAELSVPFKIQHVLREENKHADMLVNQALDQA